MIEALHAEWTKLRTLASTGWLLGGVPLLTIGLSAAVVATTSYQPFGGYQDTTKLTLIGIDLGQAVVAVLAVLIVSNEYSTQMMAVTLTALPRRTAVLAAKAANLTGAVLVFGSLAVGGCLLVGWTLLPGDGFTSAHGYQLLSLADAGTLRAAAGSVLYLSLVALFSLGIATAIRDTATAVGTVLGLLYLFPLLTQTVSDPAWHRHLQQIGPMTAGMQIQATTNLHSLPISPWGGLGVLAAWAAGALLVGGALLRFRDA